MTIEIERKFLVTGTAWRDCERIRQIEQGYLAGVGDISVRVRLQDGVATLAVKGDHSGLSREEYEYEIPLADARGMMRLCAHPPIVKARHEVRVGGKLWHVDEFHGHLAGLVIAEIELAHEAEEFERPAWLGVEVTDDPRYRNSSLAMVGLPGDGEIVPLRRAPPAPGLMATGPEPATAARMRRMADL